MDSKQRFSDRVENYVKYRPSYPEEALDYLCGTVGFGADSAVADIGAGTGIFSRLISPRVDTVFAVEPNMPMRQAATAAQKEFNNIISVAASAEETALAGNSVDFVTAAQAFHWFDRPRCKAEFGRILKPGGLVVLIWNSDIFGDDYEEIQKTYSSDYKNHSKKNLTDKDYEAFFEGPVNRATFKNGQVFDRGGFFGRVLSSSYSPLESDPRHELFMAAMSDYFARHEKDGIIALNYNNELYWGKV
jgi:SAM-dependent methyltransferase